MNGLRHFLLALQFFTRVPVTGRLAQWVGYSPQMLRDSAAHFPAIGYVVGAVGAVVFVAALAWWPPSVAAVLSTIATVLLTGAFHEDGLADVADGLGAVSAAGRPQGAKAPSGGSEDTQVPSAGAGLRNRERALEIMRDSRIGAFGAIALVLALALKLALLGALAGQGATLAAVGIVAAHVLSRLAPLAVMRALPYVGGEGGKAKPMAESVSGGALGIAVLWSLPVVVVLGMVHGAGHTATLLAAAAVATLVLVRWFRARLQGFTGDALGATQQVCELAIYLALAARP